MQNYDLAIATDHAGVKLTAKIIKFLEKKNLNVHDLGTENDESVDYPDFAHKMVEEIIEETAPKGILNQGRMAFRKE